MSKAKRGYGLSPVAEPLKEACNVIVLAVAHDTFGEMCVGEIKAFGRANPVIYDLNLQPFTDRLRIPG